MANKPSDPSDVLKQVRLNKEFWEKLQEVVEDKRYRISRTDALNRAIKFMVSQRWIPGFTRDERVRDGQN